MGLIQVMEFVCLIVTILMFLTGISPCLNMYRTGSTKNVPYEIFVLSIIRHFYRMTVFVSCGGMTHYGFMIENGVICFINGFGLSLQLAYVFVYLTCVRQKSYALSLLSACVTYLLGFYGYLYYVLTENTARAELLGSASSIVTTLLLCLPCLELAGNFRNKNADGMPLIMILGGLACGVSWLVYGLLLKDANIYGPNIPGLIISSVKLYVISLYGQDAEKIKSA